MFVHYNEELKKPIKIRLDDRNAIDENCLEQAEHLAQLHQARRYKGYSDRKWIYSSEHNQRIYEKYSG